MKLLIILTAVAALFWAEWEVGKFIDFTDF
jgi:hypothetical protein